MSFYTCIFFNKLFLYYNLSVFLSFLILSFTYFSWKYKNKSNFLAAKIESSKKRRNINEIFKRLAKNFIYQLNEALVFYHAENDEKYKNGVTKFKGEKNYSLVIEEFDDSDGGTLKEYLRGDSITFKWENQLKFAKEIASAILWLHDDKGIVHGDLHGKNIVHTIKSTATQSVDYLGQTQKWTDTDVSSYKKNMCGGSASVYTAKWMGTTTTYAIKRFRNSSKDDIINEVYLMGKVNCHPNIIKICGVTTLEGETNYSLILEYADSGTLGKYLRENAATFRWEDQLKFANDIASAILCLHSHQIIHGDLHPGNVLIHQHSIKIADFGRSRLPGLVINKQKEKAYGVIPYMDPKILKDHSCDLTEKSDIYSLGVLFWELTSRKSPFDFETKNNDPFEIIKIKSNILEGMRENPYPGTNHKFIALYKKCWQHEPNARPEIHQVILELEELNNNNEPLVVSEIFSSEEIETTLDAPENDEVNVPSYDCDINKYKL